MGHRYPPSLVTDFLDKNPNGTFTEFEAQAHSGMVPSNFNYIRKKYRIQKGMKPLRDAPPQKESKAKDDKVKRSYVRRKSALKVYSRVWSRSTVNMPKDTREAIHDLIVELNRSGRTYWEVIEILDPPELEIREVTK